MLYVGLIGWHSRDWSSAQVVWSFASSLSVVVGFLLFLQIYDLWRTGIPSWPINVITGTSSTIILKTLV